MSLSRSLLICSLIACTGCAHRVALSSSPTGATVLYRHEVIGVTPIEFTTRWVPFRPMNPSVTLTHYRSVVVPLQPDVGPLRLGWELLTLRWRRLLGVRARSEHHVLMVRTHGRAGTWTPEEATQRQP